MLQAEVERLSQMEVMSTEVIMEELKEQTV
jgi:hypothetical protein